MSQGVSEATPSWMIWVLRAAATYNIAYGAFMMAMPNAWWDWTGLARPNYPFLWAGMGMLVLLLGVGYAIVSRDPVRHVGILIIGTLSKALAFAGAMHGVLVEGTLPGVFLAAAVVHDLIWIVPFVLILAHVRRVEARRARG